MAFFGRLGNILRHAANQKISSELRSSPSIFQAIRSMSSAPSSKLFIGGVSYSTDEQSLREAFSKYGEVVDARVIVDRETGRSRGFGFITYSSVEEASSAIQALDGQELHGRQVRVNYANDRTRGYGGGGGGFGGGAGGSYSGAYGSSLYGGASGGGYGDTGSYGGNAAGGYGGGGYGGGGYGGGGYGSSGNYGGSGSGNNYSAADSFGTSSAGGGYSGGGTNYGNDGNFTSSAGGGYSGGGTNYGNDGNFTSGNTYPGGSSGGYGGNTGNFGVAGGVGGSDVDNYSNAPGFGAAGGVGNHESSAGFGGSNEYVSAGSDGTGTGSSFPGQYNGSGGLEGEPLEGNYRDDDDDTDNFAKRA